MSPAAPPSGAGRQGRRCRAAALRQLEAAACAILAILAVPRPAAAQAWVPPAGSGSVTIAAQTIDNTTHFSGTGDRLPPAASGASRDASIYVEVEYAATDRLSLAAGVPYVFAKYLGPGSLGPLQPADRCRCWHGALQDVTLTARYNVAGGATALTPSLSVGVPTHSYPYRGEAVAGRRLRELRIAMDAGRRLDALSPKLAIQGHYGYALVERVLGVAHDRSDASLEPVYAPVPALAVRGVFAWQWTHGGLRTGAGPPPDAGFPFGDITTPALFAEHDRLLRDNHFHAGAGISWSVPRLGVDLFGTYTAFVRGRDAHAGRAVTIGLSLPFQRPS